MSTRVREKGMNNMIFGIFGVLTYVTPVFIPEMIDGWPYDVVIMRVIASIACIFLCLLDYVPIWYRIRYGYIIWYLTLTFCLPFFTIYLAMITRFDNTWMMNMVLSIVLLMLLVDNVSFIIMVLIGLIGANISYHIFTHHVPTYLKVHNMHFFVYLCTFILLGIFIFVQQDDILQKKRIGIMHVFGSAIAHEVNSPIANIAMMADAMIDIVKIAEKTAQKTNEDNKEIYLVKMSATDFDMIFHVMPDGFSRASQCTLHVIKILMDVIKGGIIDRDIRSSAQNMIFDVVQLQEFDNKKKNIYIIIRNDFLFIGSQELIERVLVNLIKNAFVHGGDDTKVTITVDHGSIFVRDNGYGISNEDMRKIFKPFYHKGPGDGFGVGLAFCDVVMKLMDGRIICTSEIGKFTEFELRFSSQRLV